MVDIVAVGKFMGGRAVVGSPRSEYDFIEIIRRGLPSSAIAAVVRSAKLSEETIYSSLRIAKRTAARRKSTDAPLKARESELLYRLARAWVTARDP